LELGSVALHHKSSHQRRIISARLLQLARGGGELRVRVRSSGHRGCSRGASGLQAFAKLGEEHSLVEVVARRSSPSHEAGR
jgi:hypothetical protein